MPIPNKVLVQQLSQQQDNKCVFCDCTMQYHNGEAHLHPRAMTKEHIVPKAHGGNNEESNLVASCCRCNSLRGTIHYDLFVLIVRKLHKDADFQKYWHAKHPFIVKCLRIAVKLEVMHAYAYVCRHTAFTFLEKRKQFNPQ